MTLRLTVVAGADNGRSFVLSEGQVYVIGRGNDAQIQITDPRISRQHCQIDLTVNNGKLVDLNSTGGTFLNGEKVSESPLNEGDRIQVGDSEMVFQGDVAAQTTLTSRPTAEPIQGEFPVKDLGELVGKTIHHFQIEKKIAEGASGVVFKGTDEKKQRPVAVKVLWPELSKDEESARRFVRGMKAMFPIRHPNIVRLYSAGMYKDLCWVVMEYIEGEDLTKVIERIGTAGMLDWQFGYRVAVQIGQALAAAYEHGIVHRNITPQNILYSPEEKVCKLGDLMLAKSLELNPAEQFTRPGQLIGEIAYLAPERTGGDQEIDCRSDIYGLGATVYALLTGRPPFEANSLPELIRKIREEEPENPKKYQLSIADMFEGVVMRMLAKRPEDRFQTPDALLQDLDRIGKFLGISVE